MKFHQVFLKISEFLLILLLFVVPSIFSKHKIEFSHINEFYFSIFYIFVASFLIFLLNKKYKAKKAKKTKKITKNLLLSFITLLLLVWISYIFSFFTQQEPMMYAGFKLLILHLVYIPPLVCFEEILFRSYVYDSFSYIFSLKLFSIEESKKQMLSILFSSLLFALSHSYTGIFGIFFAFISSLLLFFIKNYTTSLFYPILIHIFYNYIAFFTLLKL